MQIGFIGLGTMGARWLQISSAQATHSWFTMCGGRRLCLI